MVGHNILLSVLNKNFGLTGTALEWCDTYLRLRSFKVCINGSYSTDRKLAYSVPQGSCAGPVFYNAYASTMSTITSEDIQIMGYADDHSIDKSINSGLTMDIIWI